MKTESVEQQNKKMRNNLTFQNYITTARGSKHTEYISSDCYEYGFTNVSFWNPHTQSWELVNDQSKFIVTAQDPDEAHQIFWDRWFSYCQRRFKHNIKLETI